MRATGHVTEHCSYHHRNMAEMHSHRKTCRRFNDVGHAHALTFSCFFRRAFLSKERSCQWLIAALDQARRRHAYHLWAYVIMPEHVHILVWPTVTDYNVGEFLKSVKQSVFRRAIAYLNQEAPSFLDQLADRQPSGKIHCRFWQRGGGYDRNLFDPQAIHQEIEYIHLNPVRRGLVARPEDWYWSSAANYAGTRIGPLAIDRDSLPTLPVFAHRRGRHGAVIDTNGTARK